MSARYAVYYGPALGSPWWNFGAHWLGRDESTGKDLPQPLLAQFTPVELRLITTLPRRYGFHATVKAPFHLSGKHTLDDLRARLEELASTLKPVALGPLQAVTLGNFVALTPLTPPTELCTLAGTCVTDLDDLRAPLTPADLARRQSVPLDAREQALLLQYGYPHVLERYQLHFTLSGPVAHESAQRVLQAVVEPVAQLNQKAPLMLDRLCLFVEPAPGEAFRRIADVRLGA